MKKTNKYTDEKGQKVEITENGYIFIDGSCVAEPGTDESFDKYATQIQNGEGYYDTYGHYKSYKKEAE